MILQSQARTQLASSHCSLYFLPHFKRGSFPLPISSAEFFHRQPKTSPFRYCSSARFVWQFSSIPTHHPIRYFIFIKIFLDNHCIFLYIIARFYEKLCFNKRIRAMEEKEIMTVKQVAEYLQMDEHTIYKLSRSGQISSVKISGQ